MPKEEVNKIFELDQETYAGLMEFSRKIAIAIEKSIPCLRVGMSVIGLEVPHVHVHLIPLNSMADIDFKHKVQLNTEEFQAIAKSIASNLD